MTVMTCHDPPEAHVEEQRQIHRFSLRERLRQNRVPRLEDLDGRWGQGSGPWARKLPEIRANRAHGWLGHLRETYFRSHFWGIVGQRP